MSTCALLGFDTFHLQKKQRNYCELLSGLMSTFWPLRFWVLFRLGRLRYYPIIRGCFTFHLICDLQYQYLKYLKSLSFLLGTCVACQLGFTILVPSSVYQVQAKAKSLAWVINHLCHIRFSYPIHIRVRKLYSLLVLSLFI